MNPDTPASSPNPRSALASVATPSPRTAADLLAQVVSARDLGRLPLTPPTWLWHGYLGPGKVTLLTSQWKSGKTTLVARVLARLQQGGQLAGLAVAPGKAFVITEETRETWESRFRDLGISDQMDLLCRPFMTQPDKEQWLALIEAVAILHDRQGIDLVVIDLLSSFLPAHTENSAGAMLECLRPLQRLTTAGLSVLLVHHPNKGRTVAGQAARGTGALPGFVDIILEMGYYSRPDDVDRRRRLVAFSRYDETPRHLLIELQPDGLDYAVLESGPEAASGESWQAVLGVLASSHHKLTRQEILDRWSSESDKPDPTTLWRWLNRAVARGQVRQEGVGRPHDPFRYWLPEREEMLYPEGGTQEELQAWNNRCLAELLPDLTPPRETALPAERAVSADESRTAAGPVAAAEELTLPPEPVLPERVAETTAPASRPPEPVPSLAADPVEAVLAEEVRRLPFPWNIMNPAEVPEEVLKRARAKRSTG
jgi:hypothetical protein